jgi:hypothetical protein
MLIEKSFLMPASYVYVVKNGDTLTDIAAETRGLDRESGAAYKEALRMAKENGIEDPNVIQPGQMLHIDRKLTIFENY